MENAELANMLAGCAGVFTLPEELQEMTDAVRKHEDRGVWSIGHVRPLGRAGDDDRLSRNAADVWGMLMRHGLQPDIM
jgi:hypothetical protein